MLRAEDRFMWKGEEKQVLKIKSGALDFYREEVKGNEELSYKKCCLKLTRDVLIGNYIGLNEHNKHVYDYGNLRIFVNEEMTKVKWLEARVGDFEYNINQSDKIELENILFRDGLSKQELRHKWEERNEKIRMEAKKYDELKAETSKGLLHNIKNKIGSLLTKEVKAKC